MRKMRWTYEELMETPGQVVDDVWRYIQTETQWQNEQVKKQRG